MKYSIITINYNHAEGLRRTIESVVNQTCKDYEYIIIDGGSTDGSVDVIKEYADKIDFWVSEPDKGIYNAMNKGIDHAHGEYLNFMNSGDCFYALTVLEEVKPLLTADIVSGTLSVSAQNRTITPPNDDISLMTLMGRDIQHQSTFIKRELNTRIKYDDNLKIVSDWKFFVEALVFQNSSYRNINVTVCEFESNGISGRDENVCKWKNEKMGTLKSLLPRGILKDYLYYSDKHSPMLDIIPSFNKTRGLQSFVCAVVKRIVAMYNIFIR